MAAEEEFHTLLGFQPAVRVDAWRRTSGMHRIRSRRALAAVRELWTTRDTIAQERDVTPGRIIPDAAIIAAATANPTTVEQLLATKGFHGRGARRFASAWVRALQTARELPEADLPTQAGPFSGPPPPRAWPDKDPIAARRLTLAREAVMGLSETWNIPPENLLTPDYLRRLMWEPPATRNPADLLSEVSRRLGESGARQWQIGLVAELLTAAILQGDLPVPDPDPQPASDPESDLLTE